MIWASFRNDLGILTYSKTYSKTFWNIFYICWGRRHVAVAIKYVLKFARPLATGVSDPACYLVTTHPFFRVSSFFLPLPSFFWRVRVLGVAPSGALGPWPQPLGGDSFALIRHKIAPWAHFFDVWHLLKSSKFEYRFRHAFFMVFFDFVPISGTILAPCWEPFGYMFRALFGYHLFIYFWQNLKRFVYPLNMKKTLF